MAIDSIEINTKYLVSCNERIWLIYYIFIKTQQKNVYSAKPVYWVYWDYSIFPENKRNPVYFSDATVNTGLWLCVLLLNVLLSESENVYSLSFAELASLVNWNIATRASFKFDHS